MVFPCNCLTVEGRVAPCCFSNLPSSSLMLFLVCSPLKPEEYNVFGSCVSLLNFFLPFVALFSLSLFLLGPNVILIVWLPFPCQILSSAISSSFVFNYLSLVNFHFSAISVRFSDPVHSALCWITFLVYHSHKVPKSTVEQNSNKTCFWFYYRISSQSGRN